MLISKCVLAKCQIGHSEIAFTNIIQTKEEHLQLAFIRANSNDNSLVVFGSYQSKVSILKKCFQQLFGVAVDGFSVAQEQVIKIVGLKNS